MTMRGRASLMRCARAEAMTLALFDCSLSGTVTRSLDPLWQSGLLAAGPAVGALEDRLSGYLEDRPVVALSDMTQALAMALRLAGVGEGDEVATLALNCMSSNSAIAMVGAVPIWIDVDPATATVDLDDLSASITSRTRAVVIYHVAGYVGDLTALRALCDARGLVLIEDANAALGATWQERRVGTVGDYAVFSFYANRQLNGIEGAALVCPNRATADRAQRLRRFGIDTGRFRTPDGEIDPSLDVPEIGLPSSLSNIHASLALSGMDDLDIRVARNRANAAYLAGSLSDVAGLNFISQRPGAGGVFWVALVRSTNRSNLMTWLKAAGVPCSRLHQRNDRYTGFGAQARILPGTALLEQEMLALPAGWWLSKDDLNRIVSEVRSAPVHRD